MSRTVRRSLTAGLATLAIASSGAGALAVSADPATPVHDDSTSPAAAGINRSLDSMAKLLARAVTDETLRLLIHDQVAKRFDGEPNALYRTLSTAPGMQDRLAAIDGLARDIPRLHVAVPARFGAWDPEDYTPLVGYAPAGVEDTGLRSITAYDSSGGAHTLDARVEPRRPVIILGQNERTNDAGRVRKAFAGERSATPRKAKRRVYQVSLEEAQLHDDQEPWIKGDAETMLITKGKGLWWHDEITYLDDSKDFLRLDKVLGKTGSGVYFYWYEKDGNSPDVTVSVKGVSLGVKIDDDDDAIGGVFMRRGLFKGTTNDERKFGELTQVTD